MDSMKNRDQYVEKPWMAAIRGGSRRSLHQASSRYPSFSGVRIIARERTSFEDCVLQQRAQHALLSLSLVVRAIEKPLAVADVRPTRTPGPARGF